MYYEIKGKICRFHGRPQRKRLSEPFPAGHDSRISASGGADQKIIRKPVLFRGAGSARVRVFPHVLQKSAQAQGREREIPREEVQSRERLQGRRPEMEAAQGIQILQMPFLLVGPPRSERKREDQDRLQKMRAYF